MHARTPRDAEAPISPRREARSMPSNWNESGKTLLAAPRVRVAALAERDGRVLLAHHRKDRREYFLLPGGGVESGEFSHAALARELREEAGVACRIGDVRYVIEVKAPNESRHLIQFVFDAEIVGDVGASADPRVVECAWHPVDDLRRLRIHPAVGGTLADDLERRNRAPRYLVARWRP